jgi:hypothetical protein
MLEESRFIAPSDDRNPVYDCKITEVKINSITDIFFTSSVKSTIDRRARRVTNFTLKGRHLLHPGRVTRTVVETAGRVYVITEGVGTGFWPRGNELFAPPAWKEVDRLLQYRVHFPDLYNRYYPRRK